jgi:hypothetical protein
MSGNYPCFRTLLILLAVRGLRWTAFARIATLVQELTENSMAALLVILAPELSHE